MQPTSSVARHLQEIQEDRLTTSRGLPSHTRSMHHHRRKSGHGSANTSYTDVRKAGAVTVTDLSRHHKSSRPAMTRRTTTQGKLGKSHRDREREMEDEYWLSDERESFPQFWYVLPPRDRCASSCSEICFSRLGYNRLARFNPTRSYRCRNPPVSWLLFLSLLLRVFGLSNTA